MTLDEAIERFKKWQVNVLVIGVLDLGGGKYGFDSTLCKTKEQVFAAIERYYTFEVYFLRKSKYGEGFFRNEAIKQKNG